MRPANAAASTIGFASRSVKPVSSHRRKRLTCSTATRPGTFSRDSASSSLTCRSLSAPTYGVELPSLDCLSARERDIIERRFGLNGRTSQTRIVIGAELGISDERVRQIETHAIAKLKKISQ